MSVFNNLGNEVEAIINGLRRENLLPEEVVPKGWSVGPAKDKSHGDLSTNVALILGNQIGKNPREIALLINDRLAKINQVKKSEVAGPGFINIFLKTEFIQDQIKQILTVGKEYGSTVIGGGVKVNVEYVSANPTGPLHVGHVRGAVFGDALANLLEKVGYKVTREYYINDAGAQIDTLARSVYLRYREALGEKIGAIPEGLYPGDYLKPVGEALAKQHGDKFKDAPEEEWLAPFRDVAVPAMMALIKEDLGLLGIHHQVFSSENALLDSGLIPEAIDYLRKKDVIYQGILEAPKGKKPKGWEPREQTLFRSTNFGDDVDRPLIKSDGSYTYFATDIAYHFDKFRRGFEQQIVVLGADHAGYIKRLKAALTAISGGKGSLDVRLCQMVRLLRGGQPVKMGKRSGQFITLREVVDEVGPGVVRFIMLTRKNDAPLDFDFDKVKEQSRDNPVFYVQYAHARAHSAFRKAKEIFPKLETGGNKFLWADLSLLSNEAEINLIKKLIDWPRVVIAAANAHEPHRIAYYLQELASEFHSLWNKGNDDPGLRFVIEGNKALTLARLSLVRALALVIAEGLELLGVEPLKEMR